MVQKQSKGFQVVINIHSDMKLAYMFVEKFQLRLGREVSVLE